MNDIEKAAIDWLNCERENYSKDSVYRYYMGLAVKALERQIPKKPKKQPYMQEEFDSGTEYLCPNCESLVGGYSDDLEDWCGQHDYCEDCGQKLDWEEENGQF